MRAPIKTYRGRILVVEEEDWCREFLSSVIKLIGQEFKLVNSVAEALEAFKEGPFDLVITDVKMPEHSHLLEECHNRSPNTRFLLVVQKRSQTYNLVYREQVDIVFKPLSLDEVVRKIRHAIRQKQLRQAEEEIRRLKQEAFRIWG
jgi:two-component system response regulator AtoC